MGGSGADDADGATDLTASAVPEMDPERDKDKEKGPGQQGPREGYALCTQTGLALLY
jgi:hypothetical protein